MKIIKKLTAQFLIAFVLLFLLNIQAIAVSKQTEVSIISIPEESSKTIEFAAEELSKYFKQMTGKDYPIKHETKKVSKSAVRIELDTNLKEDGYNIYLKAKTIYITGGNQRGCLYGAYAFLNQLGCRWPLPDKEYDVIPKLEKISWPNQPIKSEPAIKYRGFCRPVVNPQDAIDFIDYMAKNRYNTFFLNKHQLSNVSSSDDFKEAMSKRDMVFEWGTHVLPRLLPRELFDEHPEYFRMENGKRTPNLNMCPSSSGAADVMAQNCEKILNVLKQVNGFDTIYLTSDDLMTGGWCSCEKCKGLTDSDQALKITNEIAERLDLGKVKIPQTGYHKVIFPPTVIKPHPNISYVFAPRERCCHHPIDECKINQYYIEILKQNMQLFPGPRAFEYYFDYILFRHMPFPLHPIIGKDIEVYRRLGIDRIVALCFPTYSTAAYGCNYYIFANCLWNGAEDPNAMDEYCRIMYGPHAKEMKKYFDLLFELVGTALEFCGYEGFMDMRKVPDQPFNKTHMAHLAPLVKDEHLNSIEKILTNALESSQQPYRTRISNQLVLWKAAKLDTLSIYKTLVAMPKVKTILTGNASEKDRLETIELIKQAIKHSEDMGELLISRDDLHGGWFKRDEGEFKGRFNNKGSFTGQLYNWLEKLEKYKNNSSKK